MSQECPIILGKHWTHSNKICMHAHSSLDANSDLGSGLDDVTVLCLWHASHEQTCCTLAHPVVAVGAVHACAAAVAAVDT